MKIDSMFFGDRYSERLVKVQANMLEYDLDLIETVIKFLLVNKKTIIESAQTWRLVSENLVAKYETDGRILVKAFETWEKRRNEYIEELEFLTNMQ